MIQHGCERTGSGRSWSMLAAAVLITASTAVQADTQTWVRTGVGTFNWNVNGAGLWSPDVAFPNGPADIAFVTSNVGNSGQAQTLNLNQLITLNGMVLGDPIASHSNFTIAAGGGGSLTFAGAAPFLTFQGGNNNQITAPVTLASTNMTISWGGINASSTLTMSGGLTYDNAGPGTLSFSGATGTNSGVISGAISEAGGAGPLSLVKNVTGTWTLSGSNSYTGSTTLEGGTLHLNYSTNDNSKLADGAALILKTGTLNLAGGTHAEVVGSVTLAGSTQITRSAGASVLQMNTITRAANTGGAVNFAAAGIATVDNANDAAGILGGWATVGGTNWAVNSTNGDDGAVAALAPGGYTNDTWAPGVNTTVTAGGANPAANSTTHSLRFNDPGPKTLTLSGVNTIESGGILFTDSIGNGQVLITGGTLVGSADGELILHAHNTSTGVTFAPRIASAIADNGGPTDVIKTGPGNVSLLSDDNSYTGRTIINDGRLYIGGHGANSGVLGSGDVVLNGGTLSLYRTNNSSYVLTNTITGHGTIAVGSGGGQGNGTLILAADNTYSGVTTVGGSASGGTIQVGDGGTTGTVGTSVIDLSTGNTRNFIFNRSNTYQVDNLIQGGTTSSAYLKQNGTGTVILTNSANSYAGVTQINAGTLIAAADHVLGLATSTSPENQITTVAAGATLGFQGDIDYLTPEPVTITGAGDAGNARVGAIDNVSGVNLFAGPITLAGDSTIGSSAGRLTLTGGIDGDAPGRQLTVTGPGNLVIGGAGLGANIAGVFKTGSGTLDLADVHANPVHADVLEGRLLVNGSLTESTSTVVVRSGATLGGNGDLAGAVTVEAGGILAPGNSPGILTVGSLSLDAGALFSVEIVGGVAGVGYDQLVVTGGPIDITDAILHLNPIRSVTSGQVLTIIDNLHASDLIVGMFAGLGEGDTIFLSGRPFATISYAGGTGNDVTLTVIPEPATAGLLALALLGLGRRGRLTYGGTET